MNTLNDKIRVLIALELMAPDKPPIPCPSVMDMACFVAGLLADEERDDVMGHLAGCDVRRYEWVLACR